jgi:hypothetical protein
MNLVLTDTRVKELWGPLLEGVFSSQRFLKTYDTSF